MMLVTPQFDSVFRPRSRLENGAARLDSRTTAQEAERARRPRRRMRDLSANHRVAHHVSIYVGPSQSEDRGGFRRKKRGPMNDGKRGLMKEAAN
jgi:hypothetical protein